MNEGWKQDLGKMEEFKERGLLDERQIKELEKEMKEEGEEVSDCCGAPITLDGARCYDCKENI